MEDRGGWKWQDTGTSAAFELGSRCFEDLRLCEDCHFVKRYMKMYEMLFCRLDEHVFLLAKI